MKILTQIIRILKPSEVRLIRNFYKVQPNGEVKRRLELFELAKSGKGNSDAEAAKAIYNGEPNSAFSHLKNRLQKDVLNILLLQEGSKKYETKYAQAIFDCRRMLIEGQILFERGAYRAGETVLQKAYDLAEEYELYAECLQIADLLRTNVGIRKGEAAYLSFEPVIADNLNKLQKYLSVKDSYNRFGVISQFKKNFEKQSMAPLEAALEEAGRYYKETGSATIGHYYNYLGIFYGHFLGDYELAEKYAIAYLKLIEVSPAISSDTRIASANLQLASISINKGDYAAAIDYAITARDKFIGGLFNELLAIEAQFVATFHNKDYAAASKIVEIARLHPKYKANKQIPAKWDYYKANLSFVNGDYNDAAVVLMKETELTKDKAGWLMGYRVLELMCAVEQDDLDVFDYRTESFKKLLQRNKEENVLRPRTALKILGTYIKTGGDIKKTMQDEHENIELLKSGKGEYVWDAMGFELIRFDEWLDRLAKKKLKARV